MTEHSKDHISAEFEMQIIDESGITVKTVKGQSDSFLKNFLLLLQAGMQNSAVPVVDYSGTTRSCLGFSCLYNAYTTYSYVVLGTGAIPVTPNDYCLASHITDLEYLPIMISPSPTVPVINGGNIESTVFTRYLVNRTGAEILINEIGIYVLSSTFSILILRDVLGASIPLGNNQMIKVVYTIRTAI